MLKTSVSSPENLVKLPPEYLPSPTLENYQTLATQVPLLRYTLNSFIFASTTALTTVFFCFMAAYAFARIRFPGSGILLWLLVLSMALPEISTIIPLYQVLGSLNLLDSLAGLIIVMSSALAPFTVWVFVPFIRQVPIEIEESAILDGACLWVLFRKFYIPLCTPALVTMFIINFINAWNNLLYPLAFSATVNSKCLSIAITEVFQTQVPWGKPWHLISALGIIMILPAIALIFISQRAIIRGLTRGAIK
jgi:ABC-type glycerol-3-phosphate transport system permease component